MAANRLLFDLGNTRLKGARLDAAGRIAATSAAAADLESDWETLIDDLAGPEPIEAVAVASVHPPRAERLADLLRSRQPAPIQWFRSAADVPVEHALEAPERAGADRALAVLGASRHRQGEPARPGVVVQCGTAITVEAIDAHGVWRGGAIAIGPGLASRALGAGTARLPELDADAWRSPTEPFGASTATALAAGLQWGTIGAVRELIKRTYNQLSILDHHSNRPWSFGDPASAPWVLWTGGDADWIAAEIAGETAVVVPHLVLEGMAVALGFEGPGGSV